MEQTRPNETDVLSPALSGAQSQTGEQPGTLFEKLGPRLRMVAWVLGMFAASRAIVLVFAHLALPQPVPTEQLMSPLHRWDALWYAHIVRTGYEYTDDGRQHNIMYFPLFPLVTRTLLPFIPGEGERAVRLTQILIANAAALVGFFFVYLFVRHLQSESAAAWAVCFAAFFPPSLFLSAGYTEGLFLALTASAGLMMLRGRLVVAAVLVGIASACRPTFTAFVPTLLYCAWRAYAGLSYRLWRLLGIAALSVAGGLAYAGYLTYRFGSPTVYLKNYSTWRLPQPKVYSFLELIWFRPWWDRAVGFVSNVQADSVNLGRMLAPYHAILIWIPAALAIAITGLVRNRTPLRPHYLIPVLLVLVPHFASRGTFSTYEATGRFLIAAYPLYAALGMWADRGNHKPLAAMCVALMAVILTYASYCFGGPTGPFVG